MNTKMLHFQALHFNVHTRQMSLLSSAFGGAAELRIKKTENQQSKMCFNLSACLSQAKGNRAAESSKKM